MVRRGAAVLESHKTVLGYGNQGTTCYLPRFHRMLVGRKVHNSRLGC